MATTTCSGLAQVEVAADFAPDLLAVYGYPALFGPQLNATATPQSLVEVAEPVAACSAVRPAAQPGAGAGTFLQQISSFMTFSCARQGVNSVVSTLRRCHGAGGAGQLQLPGQGAGGAGGQLQLHDTLQYRARCVGSGSKQRGLVKPLAYRLGLLWRSRSRSRQLPPLCPPHTLPPTPPRHTGCILMAATGNASAGNLTIPAVSVSQAAVQLLRALAERGGKVTLRAPDLPRVDYLSAAALWVMAVGTVVAGSLWSAAELRHHLPAGDWPGGQVRALGSRQP